MGHYLTYNDFKDRGVSNVYDIFRGMPGLIVRNNGVFFARYFATSIRSDPPQPLIYIDGMLTIDSDITWLNPESVQAVEVYNNNFAPVEYSRGRSGGVILIWTKQ